MSERMSTYRENREQRMLFFDLKQVQWVNTLQMLILLVLLLLLLGIGYILVGESEQNTALIAQLNAQQRRTTALRQMTLDFITNPVAVNHDRVQNGLVAWDKNQAALLEVTVGGHQDDAITDGLAKTIVSAQGIRESTLAILEAQTRSGRMEEYAVQTLYVGQYNTLLIGIEQLVITTLDGTLWSNFLVRLVLTGIMIAVIFAEFFYSNRIVIHASRRILRENGNGNEKGVSPT